MPTDDNSGYGAPSTTGPMRFPLTSNDGQVSSTHNGQPSAPAGGAKEQLDHTRSCSAGWDCESQCTCGLEFRIQLQTEQEMHSAWRKRAEESEAEVAQLRQERDEQEANRQGWFETAKSEREARERAEKERDVARETARELNRKNGELTKTLNKETGRKAWYGYYSAANQLFKEEADKRERAEGALRTLKDDAHKLSWFVDNQTVRDGHYVVDLDDVDAIIVEALAALKSS